MLRVSGRCNQTGRPRLFRIGDSSFKTSRHCATESLPGAEVHVVAWADVSSAMRACGGIMKIENSTNLIGRRLIRSGKSIGTHAEAHRCTETPPVDCRVLTITCGNSLCGVVDNGATTTKPPRCTRLCKHGSTLGGRLNWFFAVISFVIGQY